MHARGMQCGLHWPENYILQSHDSSSRRRHHQVRQPSLRIELARPTQGQAAQVRAPAGLKACVLAWIGQNKTVP